jgi:addiction module HigA family antidote
MMQFAPPHPGEILKRDYLEALGITVTLAAEGLGIARKNLSAIINLRAGISPEMALRLSNAFDTTPDFWLNLQMHYDLSKAMDLNRTVKVTAFYKMKSARINA